MFIFVDYIYSAGRIQKYCIPESRIYDINSIDNVVNISYFDGTREPEPEGVWVEKVAVLKVHYDSPDDAANAIKNFYKACFNKYGAFYFGNNN